MKHIKPIIPMLLLTATIAFSSTPGFDTLVSYDTAWTFVYDGGKDTSGKAIDDKFFDVKVMPDGSNYCVGVTKDSLNWRWDLLIKLDASGKLLWKKCHERAGSNHSLVFSKNNNLIIGGEIGLAPMVMCLDTDGNKLWRTWYFDSANNTDLLSRTATINYLRETSRGTIVCAAGDPYPNNDGYSLNDYAAYLEFDSLGTLKRYREWENISNYEIGGFSIEETEGGNYVFGGNEAVFYLDSTGKATWKANYTFDLEGVGSEVSEVYRVKVLRNNTPFVMGKAYEGNCWTKYKKLYYDGWWSPISYESGLNSARDTAGDQGTDDILYDFTQLNNGNLVFVGEKGYGDIGNCTAVWILVTDSIGKKQYWEDFVCTGDTSGTMMPMSVVATPDSGFTIAGYKSTGPTGYDAFTVHYIPKDPTAVITRFKADTKSENSIETHLTKTKLTIKYDEIKNNTSEAYLFDLTGRNVAIQRGYGKIVMDISHLSQGTYLLKVKTDNSIRTQRILIKN